MQPKKKPRMSKLCNKTSAFVTVWLNTTQSVLQESNVLWFFLCSWTGACLPWWPCRPSVFHSCSGTLARLSTIQPSQRKVNASCVWQLLGFYNNLIILSLFLKNSPQGVVIVLSVVAIFLDYVQKTLMLAMTSLSDDGFVSLHKVDTYNRYDIFRSPSASFILVSFCFNRLTS